MLVAGCAQLPTSSEVKVGPEIQGDITNDYLYYSPNGPSSGESQQDILNGFINAGTGPQNDYSAAREYLSTSFRTKWNPNKEVLIQQGNPSISFNSNQVASVSVQVQATVDGDGHYKVMDSGASRLLSFTMVRENGEWRISSAPDLTILIRPVFEVIFRSYSIYFFDIDRTNLVPDLRWFPSRASTATRMVNAMLKGPSDWLKPAVNSAIPDGTALSLNSVTVADGVASIDLTSKALTAKALARQQMKAQIRATLTQLPNVYSVSISVERGPQEILDLPDLLPVAPSEEAVILEGGELATLDGDAISPIGGTADLINRTSATDFALTRSTEWVALKGPGGVYRSHLGIFGSGVTLIDSRPGLLSPSFDNRGFLWTMTKTSGEAVQVVAQGGVRRSLKLGWLDAFPRRQFAISAEGSRISLLVGSGQGLHAYVASIVRDKAGIPVSFGVPVEIAIGEETPASVSWSDENTVAVLGTDPADPTSPMGATLFTIGGTARNLGALSSAKTLESRINSNQIFALDGQKNLYAYRNISWSKLRSQVQALHFTN